MEKASAEVIWGAVGAGLGCIATILAWMTERAKRKATHADALDSAIEQALKGLLWRPGIERYNFTKIAAHFPNTKPEHLRHLLTLAGAVQVTGKQTGHEYWVLSDRLNPKTAPPPF